MQYLSEFFLLAVAIQMALISPGSDFMIILKQTINQGKKHAYCSTLGIGFGIAIHVAYAFFGLAIILKAFPHFLDFIRILGAIYLVYLGITSLRSNAGKIKIQSEKVKAYSFKKSFMIGFLCNLLNPKAPLFVISSFTTIVSINTPFYIKSLYGLYWVLACIFWFMLVANILSREKNMNFLNKYRNIIDKFIGIILILLGLKLVF